MVYLVGAGIGNAELVTLRGLKCIQTAEVIIYDHLASTTLLNHAKDGCTFIYAGKQAGKHHMAQEEINKVLVEHGRDKTVVRLKGGDPFVFGRGGEEIEELVKNNIDYELVPGVSSSYAAAEYAGIPVTYRGAASSFHVITGHEKSGGNSVDYAALAKLKGTLVFLMGLGAAETIAGKLMRNGKAGDTKTAIISNAASEKQQCTVGTLKTLPQIAAKMQPPAVIVVGDAIDLQNEWYKPSGKKILTTGTRSMNAQIKKAFGKMIVTEIPLIKLSELNYDKFTQTDLTDFSHIAFTSANGVSIFFDYMKRSRTDIRTLRDTKFAAVGKKTADALFEKGIIADTVPAVHNGAELAKKLIEEKCENILLIRAENGAEEPAQMLSAKGACFTDLPLYKTETDPSKKELLNLAVPDMDYIIFSSGSAARAYKEMCETEANAKFIAIGRETASAAGEMGIKIHKTAKTASAEGIFEIIGDELND